jgi:hypothetical protein
LKYESGIFTVNGLNGIFDTDMPPLITYISIAVFYAFTDKPVEPKYIVIVTSYYWILGANMQYFFIRALMYLVGGVVSLKRVQEYLQQTEILEKKTKAYSDDIHFVRVENVNASFKQVCHRFMLWAFSK